MKTISENLSLMEKCSLLSGREVWYSTKIPEKGVPAITFHDGPHGVRIDGVENTIYPNLCLLGCSFDKNALNMIGKMIGNDCVKNKVDVLLAPGVNLKRTVTGGRNFEYLSEDAFLCGELASAYVNGVQSTGTSATVKHFCCNNQENYRMSTSSNVDDEVLFNTYFKPFKAVIENAKPDCIMTSYNLVNGERTNESNYLQRKVLRDTLGFDGVIMSDWGAVIDKVAAVKNGCDLEMPGGKVENDMNLERAVANGELDESIVNGSVERMLALIKKHVGADKKTTEYDKTEIISDIVSESIVMLKNEGILPLVKGEKIGVYGDCAVNALIQGGGCAKIKLGEFNSPLKLLKENFEVVFVPTGADIAPLKNVDKVIAFVSGACTDSEAYDRDNIDVNTVEKQDVSSIFALNENVVVILQSGGVLDVADLPCKALLATYYGGQYYSEGLMKILLGKSPSGRLAETFPIKIENSPAYLGSADKYITSYREGDYIGYKYYDKKCIKPLYPFGYGLSYAKVRYNSFDIITDRIEKGKSIKAKIEIENQSGIATKEVLQVYYNNGKIKNLVWFDKVELKPFEKRTVNCEIAYKQFETYKDGAYVLEDEEGCLSLSKNSLKDVCTAKIKIVAGGEVKVNYDMLIGDLVDLAGPRVVAKFFSKAIGCALYSDENFVLPATDEYLSNDEFCQKNSMMMPIRNLASFSWKFSKDDLDKAIDDFENYLKNNR